MTATLSRVALAPLLFLLVYLGGPWQGWSCAIVFILGSITDGLDGYWARKYSCETNMGKLMDPVADKIFILAALILLQQLGRVLPIIVFLFIGRDILIGGLRSVAAANQIIIGAKPMGKWKTALQMVSLPTLFVYDNIWGLPLIEVAQVLLWISLVLSLWSAIEYTASYLKATSLVKR